MVDDLSSNFTLKDYQGYVAQIVKKRGFEKETISDIFILLVEEVGELAKIIRRVQGLKLAQDSKVNKNISYEIVDCLIYLLDLANQLNIDLAKAFREKEKMNKKRKWA